MPNISKKEWETIISQAFSPDASEPDFSESYQRRKKDILKQADDSAERSITMSKSRIGFAVLTACVAGMAGLAIYGGLNVYQMGRTVQSTESSFHPGAVAEVAETEPETPAHAYGVEFWCTENDYTANGGLYDIAFGYLPENLKYDADNQSVEEDGITRSLEYALLRVADVSKPFATDIEDAVSYEKFVTASGNDAVYVKTIEEDDNMLFVHFKDTPYVIVCSLLEQEESEIQRFADDLYLTETDEENFCLWTGEDAYTEEESDIPDTVSDENKLSIEDMPYVERVEIQCAENDYTANGGYYELVCGWVPGNLELREDGAYGGKYHDYTDEDSPYGITPSFGRVADVSEPYVQDVMYAAGRFETDLDSNNQPKHVILIDRDRGYDRLFVAFEGTPYVADYYINGMTQEEALKVAENMALIESDTERAGIVNSSYTIENQIGNVDYYISKHDTVSDELLVDWDNLHLVHVGDTVNKAAIWGDSEYHEYPDIQLTVNSASLQKTFDGITTDSIGQERDFSKYLDENGELHVNREKIKIGNGITTIDEVVEDIEIQQYVLKLDLTLFRTDNENDEDDFDNGLCFQGACFTINENGVIQDSLYDGEEGVQISREPQLGSDTFFSFATDHEHEKNGIYDLQPGESTDVTLYYTVDKDRIGNLYVNLFGNEYTTNMGMPVLDLTDLTAPE